MAAQENSIDDAVAAVAIKDYERAESILLQLNGDSATRSLRGLFTYAQIVEVQGRPAPVEQLMVLASEVDTNKAEEAYFLGEMASLLFLRKTRSFQDLEKVTEYLKRSLELGFHPDAAALLNNICRAYFELGDYKSLSRYAEQLYAFPDYRIRAALLLAHSCLRLHDGDRGNAYLDDVLDSADNIEDADLSWMFELLIFYGRFTDAQEVIDRLGGGQHQGNTLDNFQAQVWFAEHRIDDALKILTDAFCESDAHDIKTRTKLLFMRGRCLDETGNYSAAFAVFQQTNELTRRLHDISGSPDISANYEEFEYDDLPLYQEPESTPYVPTFMIGFPRSGTTLLESVLDTQDEILTLSETQGIQKSISLLRTWGMSYPQDLCILTANQVRDLRSIYFDHNKHLDPQNMRYSLVVDKLPLNILHVPLILVLFPSAKFLLSLRHPLDVCLSCFQQNFEISNEMSYFTDLGDTFRRYAGVMNQFEKFRASLNFPLLEVRYEEMVADFDTVVMEVFEFLEHEAGKEYTDFHRLKNRKPVLTPSNLQVTREVYQSSCERWRNYASELEEYAPLVEELVRRYGYTT